MTPPTSTPRSYLTINGQRIAVICQGDPANPPVIFVHGWLSHADIWYDTLALLSDEYYCVAIDLLGFGFSDKPMNANYGITAQAQRVLTIADTLGFEQFALFGHSMGGHIATTIAAQLAPERVTKLVSVAGVMSGRLHPFVHIVGAQMFVLQFVPILGTVWRRWVLPTRALVYLQYGTWYHNFNRDYRDWALDREMALIEGIESGAFKAFRGMLAHDLTDDLTCITAPVLSVFGSQDAVVPAHDGITLAQLAPQGQLALFESCGHFPMVEARDSYAAAITAFMAGSR